MDIGLLILVLLGHGQKEQKIKLLLKYLVKIPPLFGFTNFKFYKIGYCYYLPTFWRKLFTENVQTLT